MSETVWEAPEVFRPWKRMIEATRVALEKREKYRGLTTFVGKRSRACESEEGSVGKRYGVLLAAGATRRQQQLDRLC